MLFALSALIVTLAVLGWIARPLFAQAPRDAEEEQSDLALYEAQLQELDQDVARGKIAPEEAEAARTEIARRLLNADRSRPSRSLAQGPRPGLVALGLGGLVAASAAAGYAWLGAPGYGDMPRAARMASAESFLRERPSQAEIEASHPAEPKTGLPEDYLQTVEKLREVVRKRPDDVQGLQFLARHEAFLGNYATAAEAQRRAIALKGAAATSGDRLQALELMVFATGGYVSPESEALIREVVAQDPKNRGAQFYSALLFDQAGRPDLSFNLWRQLIEAGRGDSYEARAMGLISQAALRAGVDYTPPALPGPGPEAIAAAEDMAPEDRRAMIEDMVNGLAERLASEGGDASEWARLISSLGVLGQQQRAEAIWNEAQSVFAQRPEDLVQIRAAAKEAGVAE